MENDRSFVTGFSVRYDDQVFGQLTWDPLLICWLGVVQCPAGRQTEVVIEPPIGDLPDGFRRAHESLKWVQTNEKLARKMIARALIEMWNKSFRTVDDSISEDEFVERIELIRIKFFRDGSLEHSYDAIDIGGCMIDGDFAPDRTLRAANPLFF